MLSLTLGYIILEDTILQLNGAVRSPKNENVFIIFSL